MTVKEVQKVSDSPSLRTSREAAKAWRLFCLQYGHNQSATLGIAIRRFIDQESGETKTAA